MKKGAALKRDLCREACNIAFGRKITHYHPNLQNNPDLYVSKLICNFVAENAVVAQLVEHQLPKLRVAGSSPVYRSICNPAADYG